MKDQELAYDNTKFVAYDIDVKTINKSMLKTFPLQCYKISALKKVGKIQLKDIVPIMDDQEDTKKTKNSL